MDTKKILQKLIKIAENQQKIIEKLSQDGTREVEFIVPDQPGPPVPPPHPPVHLPTPDRATHLAPKKIIWQALPSTLQAALYDIRESGPDMHYRFKPGQDTQANFNALKLIMQQLSDSNKLPHAYNLVKV